MCHFFNFKFLNIFLIQNIDDNWRYNVVWYIYYVIYNRVGFTWIHFLFSVSIMTGYQPSFSWWLFSQIHLQYQRITKRVFYDSCNSTPTCRSTMTRLSWDELNLSFDLIMYFLPNHTMHNVQHFHQTIAIDPTTRAFTIFIHHVHWLTDCVLCILHTGPHVRPYYNVV